MIGDTERAVEWLDRSMREGDGRVDWIRRDPLLAGIPEHPRFQRILTSMESRRQRPALDAKQERARMDLVWHVRIRDRLLPAAVLPCAWQVTQGQGFRALPAIRSAAS